MDDVTTEVRSSEDNVDETSLKSLFTEQPLLDLQHLQMTLVVTK